jgi:selenocysteine lyase/cysteine desulfurase
MKPIPSFRKHFPVLTQVTYLNTAAWGLLHEDLYDWRQEQDLDYLVEGSDARIKSLALLDQTRERIGASFHCPADRIGLVPNFSLGLNLLLEGLPRSSKVVLLEGDYPSVNWPFESRDYEVRTVPLGATVEEDIRALVGEWGADVLALSLVQWVSGLLIAPAFLRALKQEFPGLLVIADGTQYLGAFGLDFEAGGIDILGASGYKWLLGGNGNGFILHSPYAETRIDLRASGFNAAGGDLAAGDRIPFARRLEPGHLDTVCFGSLYVSLGLLQELGLERIEAYNRQLSASARAALADLGMLDPVAGGRPEHSTIFNIPDTEGLYKHLRANDLVCSRRGGGIRLAFHCYNSENDLDRLVELIKNYHTS